MADDLTTSFRDARQRGPGTQSRRHRLSPGSLAALVPRNDCMGLKG